jgi:hypothetical protein
MLSRAKHYCQRTQKYASQSCGRQPPKSGAHHQLQWYVRRYHIFRSFALTVDLKTVVESVVMITREIDSAEHDREVAGATFTTALPSGTSSPHARASRRHVQQRPAQRPVWRICCRFSGTRFLTADDHHQLPARTGRTGHAQYASPSAPDRSLETHVCWSRSNSQFSNVARWLA